MLNCAEQVQIQKHKTLPINSVAHHLPDSKRKKKDQVDVKPPKLYILTGWPIRLNAVDVLLVC